MVRCGLKIYKSDRLDSIIIRWGRWEGHGRSIILCSRSKWRFCLQLYPTDLLQNISEDRYSTKKHTSRLLAKSLYNPTHISLALQSV